MTLVNTSEIELVAETGHFGGGDYEFGERIGEAVLVQEFIEREGHIGAEAESGRLNNNTYVHRGQLEHAGEGARYGIGVEKSPGGELAFVGKKGLKVLNQ